VAGRDLTGERLGPYRLEAAIDEGAFGRRYRARHVDLDSPRVIEVRETPDPAFQDAARAAAARGHTDATTVLDFGADGDLEYLVTDPAGSPVTAVRPAAAPARRRPLPAAPHLAAAAIAILAGASIVAAVTGAAHAPRPGAAPAPTAALGVPLHAGGLTLTVLTVDAGAAPPATLSLDPGDRFVTVVVRCQDTGAARAPVSPYDWVVTDAAGDIAAATAEGVDGPLPQRMLRPGQSAEGRIGFVVPSSGQGLRLHYDAERGDGSAQAPLT
jgi:hypothetical protein